MAVGGHGDWHPHWRSVEALSFCYQCAQGASSSSCLGDAQQIWCLLRLCSRLDTVPHALVGDPASLLPYHIRCSIESAFVGEILASSATMVVDGGQKEVGRICF